MRRERNLPIPPLAHINAILDEFFAGYDNEPVPLELLFDLALTDADRKFLAVMKVGL